MHVIEATATGTLSMAILLANLRVNSGDDVHLIYSRRPETPPKIEDLFDVKVKKVYREMSGAANWLHTVIFLRKYAAENQVDYLILHSSFAGFLGRIAFAFSKTKIKILYIPHCISLLRKDVSTVKYAAFLALEYIAALVPSRFVACSIGEKKMLERYFSKDRVDLIENAVPNIPKKLENNKKYRRIVTVGQIRRQKNPMLFAEIAQKTNAIDRSIDFMWIGDGDPEMRSMLERSGVVVTGWKGRDDVIDGISESSLYLSTSSWEGLPVSVIEALSLGVPTLLSACVGNEDVAAVCASVELFTDASEAVSAISSIFSEISVLQTKVEAEADFIARRYSVERYAKEFDNLITAND